MPSIHTSRGDPDALARSLRALAKMARKAPPVWDAHGMSVPVCSPGGGMMGRLLYGRGLYLNDDLKSFGITRSIRGVYERSATAWLTDFFRDASYEKAEAAWRAAERAHRAKLDVDDKGLPTFVRDPERGAITSLDTLIAARIAKGEDRQIMKTSITTASGAWSTLFRAGGMPQAGAYTTIPTGSAPSKDTAGSWAYGLSNPTNPDKKYWLACGISSNQAISFMQVYDLLVEAGNIPVTTTGTKTLSTTALTRYTTGAGVMVAFIVTTALGVTVGSMNLLSYTDQSGNTGSVGQTFATAASTIVERTLPNSGTFNQCWVPLAAGDSGVRAISTLNVATAPGAGVIACEMVFPLVLVPGISANIYAEYPPSDIVSMAANMTELGATSGFVIGCICGYILAGAASSGNVLVNMKTVAG